MNRIMGVVLLGVVLSLAVPAVGEDDRIAPVRGLIERVLPGHSEMFELELLDDGAGKDVYELGTRNGKILVRGNSLSALCTGFGHYLRRDCRVSVSWFAACPVDAPAELPSATTVRRECAVNRRFFLNYCTYGYTMPWWQWRDWERLIDWMALNGVNTPLAITGQEAIWLNVWQSFGLTAEQARAYFSGPAHLPWHRMANIDYWQGPLPMSYIDHQVVLQKQILERQRQLGMTPVLPAFAGHVPLVLKEVHPQADIKPLGEWAGFTEDYATHFLDPFDPLFARIQKTYLAEQTRVFGTDHVYGIDPFNEITPPSWDPSYLKGVSTEIFRGLEAVDPEAIWLQMGWMFFFQRSDWTNERIRAMLSGVPEGHMILLDYYVEHTEVWRMTESFFGTDFLWCTVGNFGGHTSLMGNMDRVSSRFREALAEHEGGNLAGVGCTLEGMGVNELLHTMVLELPWMESFDSGRWLHQYAERRSGGENAKVQEAWALLRDTVYTKRNASGGAGSILTHRFPSFSLKRDSEYSNKKVVQAWGLLLQASDRSKQRDAMRYDVVNVARQALVNHLSDRLEDCRIAYEMGDAEALGTAAEGFVGLARDIDRLLSTRGEFLLGTWLSDAVRFGADDEERRYYLQNAKVILSTWGPQGHGLSEYARREWAGLISSYYLPRWEVYFRMLAESLETGRPFDTASYRTTLDAMAWTWTQNGWIEGVTEPTGDSYALAEALFETHAEGIMARPLSIGEIVGTWTPALLGPMFETRSWTLKGATLEPGRYRVSFTYTGGRDALRMRNVRLSAGSVELTGDAHEGWAGHQNRRNTFYLDLAQAAPAGSVLVAEIVSATEGSTDSSGTISLTYLGAP